MSSLILVVPFHTFSKDLSRLSRRPRQIVIWGWLSKSL